jgi:hypothetical protein
LFFDLSYFPIYRISRLRYRPEFVLQRPIIEIFPFCGHGPGLSGLSLAASLALGIGKFRLVPLPGHLGLAYLALGIEARDRFAVPIEKLRRQRLCH